jgi:hypothetical protein
VAGERIEDPFPGNANLVHLLGPDTGERGRTLARSLQRTVCSVRP